MFKICRGFGQYWTFMTWFSPPNIREGECRLWNVIFQTIHWRSTLDNLAEIRGSAQVEMIFLFNEIVNPAGFLGIPDPPPNQTQSCRGPHLYKDSHALCVQCLHPLFTKTSKAFIADGLANVLFVHRNAVPHALYPWWLSWVTVEMTQAKERCIYLGLMSLLRQWLMLS